MLRLIIERHKLMRFEVKTCMIIQKHDTIKSSKWHKGLIYPCPHIFLSLWTRAILQCTASFPMLYMWSIQGRARCFIIPFAESQSFTELNIQCHENNLWATLFFFFFGPEWCSWSCLNTISSVLLSWKKVEKLKSWTFSKLVKKTHNQLQG